MVYSKVTSYNFSLSSLNLLQIINGASADWLIGVGLHSDNKVVLVIPSVTDIAVALIH